MKEASFSSCLFPSSPSRLLYSCALCHNTQKQDLPVRRPVWYGVPWTCYLYRMESFFISMRQTGTLQQGDRHELIRETASSVRIESSHSLPPDW